MTNVKTKGMLAEAVELDVYTVFFLHNANLETCAFWPVFMTSSSAAILSNMDRTLSVKNPK
jgi:hypothetical protein